MKWCRRFHVNILPDGIEYTIANGPFVFFVEYQIKPEKLSSAIYVNSISIQKTFNLFVHYGDVVPPRTTLLWIIIYDCSSLRSANLERGRRRADGVTVGELSGICPWWPTSPFPWTIFPRTFSWTLSFSTLYNILYEYYKFFYFNMFRCVFVPLYSWKRPNPYLAHFGESIAFTLTCMLMINWMDQND